MDAELLEELAERYAAARRRDRPQIVENFIGELMELDRAADEESVAFARMALVQLGGAPDFVLQGTLQQQVTCKLAIRLGLRLPRTMSRSMKDLVVMPLIDALIKLLRLGAPTTRDTAVEGLGALLKLVDHAEVLFPSSEPLPVMRDANEDDAAYASRRTISNQYFARLERRRLMVLTIAGHPKSHAEFLEKLEEPIAGKVSRLLLGPNAWNDVEHALNVHSDLLRILPAMARQGRRLPDDATSLLCAAAGLVAFGTDAPPASLVALTRFQESVFRTIDAALRRTSHWKWQDFDESVAAAVRAIPQSIGGPPSVCNGQIRATVAMLRTAIRLVIASGGKKSDTKAAIEPLFHNLGRHMRWSNLGIVEGCYRGLAELTADARLNDLISPALEALFAQFKHSYKTDDLVEIHRHLIANACFRRMLILVAERGRPDDVQDALKVEQQLRLLLREPTGENVLRVCQRNEGVIGWPTAVLPSDASHTIIAGIAFESDLLRRSASIFQRWPEQPTVDRVLLNRILAAQLHAISRDAPEMQAHPALHRIFSGIETISMNDREAMNAVWSLLSSLPPAAADSADAEVQRFVEYRGWGGGELPGYVLAMISPDASGRIAGAIAREIDLNLRRERHDQDNADFAKLLHQVMLRGPHESIFDQLLPRIEDLDDRDTVRLFRRHVASVLHAAKTKDVFDIRLIRKHVRSLLPDLKKQTSPTLTKLHETLDLFMKLTANKTSAWKYMTEKVIPLFTALDELAAGEEQRTPLADVFKPRLVELQEEVAHYVATPIGNFDGRKDALRKAGNLSKDIERSLVTHRGLQPPERSLLITLMQKFSNLFEQTIRYYCDGARRYRETNDGDHFWIYFCDGRSRKARIAAATELEKKLERKLIAEQARRTEIQRGGARNPQAFAQAASERFKEHHDRIKELIGSEPPPFPSQRAKEYYVLWMASDLDVLSLKRVLHDRWPPWVRFTYKIVTSFWWTSSVILLSCGIAALDDFLQFHAWEGLGFFVITVGIIGAAILSFTRIIHLLAKWRRRKKHYRDYREKPGYWFTCLLPRLARLTAVPMALIVEFDHSYEFPLVASTGSLLLLMIISFVTTKFFVTREMVDRKEQPGVVTITREQKRRVRQIVGLALAHSFGIAVLLSAIFAPSHQQARYAAVDHRPAPVHHTAVAVSPFWKVPVAILDRLDSRSAKHPRQRFLGVIPREVTFDIGRIAQLAGHPLPDRIAELVGFRFYPTVILTWTALGLFFGVFLEGFIKGERLRGIATRETDSA
jgi:hypothetical protein